MSEPRRARPSQTKIVATVGPACSPPGMLVELIRAGVDVFRINTAHGGREQQQGWFDAIRAAGHEAGIPVAILVDLAGPKIRLGELPGGEFQCATGATVRFVRGDRSDTPGVFTVTYEPLLDELRAGDSVMLADGIVALQVEELGADAAACRVLQGGVVRSRQGVNLPGVRLSAPAMSEVDRANAVWAAGAGADFISLSFVRSAEDLLGLKSLLSAQSSEAHVIAKIEKPEALKVLPEIVQAADGIMVARGDLGVEVDIAELPVIQKRIIAECNAARKPVIVATQMLDSMQRSRLPTRAETTDVATAILQGADACMLSGETAVGEYPREAVEMMHRIAVSTETLTRDRGPLPPPNLSQPGLNPVTEGTVYCAGRLAEMLQAMTIVVVSASGRTALSLSKSRLFVPTLGVSESEAALRRMCLYWGVIPVAGVPTETTEAMVRHLVERGRGRGVLHQGDRVVLIAGTGLKSSRHNAIIVHEVES